MNNRLLVGVSLINFLKTFRLIFWDFDGVIKDSVEVKTKAFVKLFKSYGPSLVNKVKSHHEANGGMSRFKKIPLYLSWAGEDPSKERVNYFCDQFSQLSLQGVVNAPWVTGIEDYLRLNPNQQIFVLVSATPKEELELIIQALRLQSSFTSVYGAPSIKKEAIRITLESQFVNPQECLMIGDARTDLDAAEANQIQFLLRQHDTNFGLFEHYKGPYFTVLTEL